MKKKVKRLYLDVCVHCRPFDDQSAMRIRLETDSYFMIMAAVQEKRYKCVVSPVHIMEIEKISNFNERMELLTILSNMKSNISYQKDSVRKRIMELIKLKFGPADAAHIAFAEVIADVFITCDDILLKKAKKYNISIPVVAPLDFISKEELK